VTDTPANEYKLSGSELLFPSELLKAVIKKLKQKQSDEAK